MGILNGKGYESSSYAEKRAELVEVFKTAFGNNIRTDEESAQGQIIDYYTSLMDNEDKIGLSFFNQLNYRNAEGVLLSMIAITKGQPRRSGTKAVITCDFTSTATPYSITVNSLFKDTANNLEFVNDALIDITSLTQSAQLIANDNGRTDLIITNTLDAQGYYPNLTNIEITAIQDGTDDESDSELIARLSESDSESGINDVEAIFDRLNRLNDTSRVVVIENDTESEVDGVPAHGIEALVLGGLDQDIAEVIFNTKASGTPTAGSEEVTVIDSQGFSRIIRFGRPTLIPTYVRVRITSRDGVPIAGNFEDLRQSTMDYVNQLNTGQDVSRTPISAIWGTGTFDVSQISLSTDGIIYNDANIVIGIREYAFVDNINQIIVENV
jgi:uncharacterized phage protein gp47/JayE